MTLHTHIPVEQASVVGRSSYPQNLQYRYTNNFVHFLRLLACIFIACFLIFSVTPHAIADETPSPTSSASQAVPDFSGNILDTQNLLGNNLSKVTDAIKQTYEDTGVTVRLIYINSFNSKEKPEKWASQTLQSLDPASNTVLLAVASNDGNLVVVVSPNSDEWLQQQSTVDKLSEAAATPLHNAQADGGPDWSASALDFMQAIQTAKRTSTSHTAANTGVIVLIAVLAILVIGIIVLIVVRRRREVDSDAKEVVMQEEEQEERQDHNQESSNDSADVQETSSTEQ